MAELKEARVPDIGDYDGVPVIELLVAVGDTVKQDQGLVTLESDKATMEVPAPFAGVVRELKVKVGDKLSEGSVVAMIEASRRAPRRLPSPPSAGCPLRRRTSARSRRCRNRRPGSNRSPSAPQADKIAQTRDRAAGRSGRRSTASPASTRKPIPKPAAAHRRRWHSTPTS